MEKKNNIHTISLLVANKPGVLIRCAQIFARRGFNVDSLVVSPAVNPKFSRMTITAQGDPATLEQIIKQTAKLIDVVHAEEHREEET
ncbi:MAG: acetolactate synthase small subunit, partial [Candidatus Omnitrophica bacterium]|nr:acetolactate synthase small subunit [Candidatus Omnitrophota bacterium]